MSEPMLLDKRQAAKSLSISIRTLDSLIKQNIVSVRRVGRRVLISRASLEQFANSNTGVANAK
jgi:excisionase family DNA binding protein